MAGKGLPKKYAKMGFKKGWAAFKRSRKGGTRKRTTYSKPKKTPRRRSYMAKRKISRQGHKKPVSKKGLVLFAINNAVGLDLPWVKYKIFNNPEGPMKGLEEVNHDIDKNHATTKWINAALIYKFGDCGLLKYIDPKLGIRKKSAAITYLAGTKMNYPWMANRIKYVIESGDTDSLQDVYNDVSSNSIYAAAQGLVVYKYGSPIKYKGMM